MSQQPNSSDEIVSARGKKNVVHPAIPYAFLTEKERLSNGKVEECVTIFLTNRECAFRCLMCDLWKNTTDFTVTDADLEQQFTTAFDQLGIVAGLNSDRQIKIYNSGNFFDPKSIPASSVAAVAARINRYGFGNTIVENHPKLCDHRVVQMANRLENGLEIAMGLETVHPVVLPRLNKKMTTADFQSATQFLLSHEIKVRAFILLKPPFLSEEEGVEWALKSIDFAFKNGVECCAVIPTRKGNGIMDSLPEGQFSEPALSSLESVSQHGLALCRSGQRLFVDIWDAERFSKCSHCFEQRSARLNEMNLRQVVLPEVDCPKCSSLNQ
jgi:hypothetical protein